MPQELSPARSSRRFTPAFSTSNQEDSRKPVITGNKALKKARRKHEQGDDVEREIGADDATKEA